MRLYNAKVTFATSCFNPRICKRCDFRVRASIVDGKRFNPRICKRCDKQVARPAREPRVSIHASVKDATNLECEEFARRVRFNPRICKRCDSYQVQGEFQNYGFNPRICKRCDSLILMRSLSTKVSIHASVKDATYNDEIIDVDKVFQSTHL